MIITDSEREYILGGMRELLTEYGYAYTDNALKKIVTTWARQKETLIEAFKNHPNYLDGKFMIAFDQNYERPLDESGARAFWHWLEDKAITVLTDIPADVDEQRREDSCRYLPHDLWNFLENMHAIATRTVSEATADEINRLLPNIRAHKGEKTSRVINRICTYLGYDKADGYNREFAKFADSLSPMVITRHTVLSINPLDYLTMSFGNSWSSCHTIDKNNKRGMPNSYHGCYSSGTISYMLDGSSMVFYTVESSYDGNDYWTQPKINRQMFHYGEDKLVQGRLYPQDNDGCDVIYAPNRNIVQEIIAKIFDFPNLWTLSKGTAEANKYIRSVGTHYRDYRNYGNCTLSVRKDSENKSNFTVGANPICVKCGRRHSDEENIKCDDCDDDVVCCDCGDEVDVDDAIEYNGRYYCRRCVSTCPICGEVVPDEVTTYIETEDRDVCPSCLDQHYRQCEDCGEYVWSEDLTYVDGQGYLCEDCMPDESEAS